MAINSSILAWGILWTEEPGPWGCKRGRHNRVTNTCFHFLLFSDRCCFFWKRSWDISQLKSPWTPFPVRHLCGHQCRQWPFLWCSHHWSNHNPQGDSPTPPPLELMVQFLTEGSSISGTHVMLSSQHPGLTSQNWKSEFLPLKHYLVACNFMLVWFHHNSYQEKRKLTYLKDNVDNRHLHKSSSSLYC